MFDKIANTTLFLFIISLVGLVMSAALKLLFILLLCKIILSISIIVGITLILYAIWSD